MTNLEEKIIKEFREKIQLYSPLWVDKTQRSDGTYNLNGDATRVIEEYILSALAQQREEIVKEILNTFDRVQEDIRKEGFDYEPHYYGIVQDFLDSLTSSAPEEKKVFFPCGFPQSFPIPHTHSLPEEKGDK